MKAAGSTWKGSALRRLGRDDEALIAPEHAKSLGFSGAEPSRAEPSQQESGQRPRVTAGLPGGREAVPPGPGKARALPQALEMGCRGAAPLSNLAGSSGRMGFERSGP